MIHALLHGKLSREQENMEDLLTSMVFGAFRHLPAGCLGDFIGRSRLPAGDAPLRFLKEATGVEMHFWPKLPNAVTFVCEPDVDLRFCFPDGSAYRVLVEAKYRSGKSSVAGSDEGDSEISDGAVKDQLAREWSVLERDDRAALVYLTADIAMPHSEIRDTQEELLRRRGREGQILWLAWSEVVRMSRALPHAPRILQEAADALMRMRLEPFDRLRFPNVPPPAWRFRDSAPQSRGARAPLLMSPITWPALKTGSPSWRFHR